MLVDRQLRGRGNIRASTAMEVWVTEDEVRDSFTPLQIDVFLLHAMWEDYHGPTHPARPAGSPSRGDRKVELREAGLSEFPVGAQVGQQSTDLEDKTKPFRGKLCDFSNNTY